MNTFFQLLVLIFSQISLNNYINCSEDINSLINNITSEDFWDWMFGSELEDNNQSSLEHIQEEIGAHYGIQLSSGDQPFAEQEIDFHVFNFHDFDKNKLLDGLEMLAMMHNSEDHHKPSQDRLHNLLQSKHKSYVYNAALIDTILRNEDLNNDGFLDYTEFVNARNKHKNILKSLKTN